MPGLVLCSGVRDIKSELDDLVVRSQHSLGHGAHPGVIDKISPAAHLLRVDFDVVPIRSTAHRPAGQSCEELLWSPQRPRLIDVVVHVDGEDRTHDAVSSYLGLRSTAVDRRLFLLNDRPRYVRSMLSQG
ncbi:hypothetical protein ASF63_18005 [Microbacterium sp. Leaf320]|nr:hypothetical protein ASF63_18005 [Microbacterium sp. Leaf320]